MSCAWCQKKSRAKGGRHQRPIDDGSIDNGTKKKRTDDSIVDSHDDDDDDAVDDIDDVDDVNDVHDGDDDDDGVECPPGKRNNSCPTPAYISLSLSDPVKKEKKKINCNYVRNLESEFECLQKAFLSLTTHFARLQFRLRQIMQAAPEERFGLLCDLERIAFEGADDKNSLDELPRIQRDIRCMGDVRRKVNTVVNKLRSQLETLSQASELSTLESGDEESSKTKIRRSRQSSENEFITKSSQQRQGNLSPKISNQKKESDLSSISSNQNRDSDHSAEASNKHRDGDLRAKTSHQRRESDLSAEAYNKRNKSWNSK